MESAEAIRTGDEVTHGHYLEAATFPELLRRAGLRTAIAGTKPVARLFDRTHKNVAITQTKFSAPNTAADAETTAHLIGKAWDNGVPQFSLLWLSEPDLSQHNSGPGSPKALAALRSSDHNLGRVLDELQVKGVRDKTDVFVVSDHGFSTVSRSVNLVGILTNAGFSAVGEFKGPPKPGQILVVGLGGSALFYVMGHDAVVTDRLAEFFQRQDFTGVIFTRRALPGTFALEEARLNTANAPDMVVAMRWSDQPSARGVPGLLISTGTLAPGKGSHASLSRYDIHNTLIVNGPDFRGGVTNDLPSSNTDVAPTILTVLGVKPSPMDGRVLTKPTPAPRQKRLKASAGNWQQYLEITECGGAFYIDEGNGTASPK